MDRSHMQQKDFAAKINVTDGYLSQILSGARRPGMDIAEAIEAETGVPMVSWVDTRRGKADRPSNQAAK